MANTTQEKQTVSKLGAHVSTSHKSLHQRKEMLYFSSLLSFLLCIFLRFVSLISDVWALTYTALFHWWTLTFARVKCLSCVSEMAPVFLILLAAGCWLLGQLLCHVEWTCGWVMSFVDAAQHLTHPRAALASDSDEACWKHTPVPPAPPKWKKQIAEKLNCKQLHVLIRLAVVDKRECRAFLRRSIVKVE